MRALLQMVTAFASGRSAGGASTGWRRTCDCAGPSVHEGGGVYGVRRGTSPAVPATGLGDDGGSHSTGDTDASATVGAQRCGDVTPPPASHGWPRGGGSAHGADGDAPARPPVPPRISTRALPHSPVPVDASSAPKQGYRAPAEGTERSWDSPGRDVTFVAHSCVARASQDARAPGGELRRPWGAPGACSVRPESTRSRAPSRQPGHLSRSSIASIAHARPHGAQRAAPHARSCASVVDVHLCRA